MDSTRKAQVLGMKWHEKLKFARKILKLSLRDVEGATGISNPYLCQLENGQIKEPSFFKMMALINFYNLSLSDFIEVEFSNAATRTQVWTQPDRTETH